MIEILTLGKDCVSRRRRASASWAKVSRVFFSDDRRVSFRSSFLCVLHRAHVSFFHKQSRMIRQITRTLVRLTSRFPSFKTNLSIQNFISRFKPQRSIRDTYVITNFQLQYHGMRYFKIGHVTNSSGWNIYLITPPWIIRKSVRIFFF